MPSEKTTALSGSYIVREVEALICASEVLAAKRSINASLAAFFLKAGRFDGEEVYGGKDTISARKQSPSSEKLGHDAAHRPDVHCNTP